MPFGKQSSGSGHEWTSSEMHTLLCLMAKGLHIEQPSKRSDTPGRAKRHAHLEVATALNNAIHKNDYENDIPKREVSRMIDKIIEERKTIVGSGGYMERVSHGCMTRGLKRMWDRSTKFDFDGSESEWKLGRKEREIEKLRISNGGAAVDEPLEEGEITNDSSDDNDEAPRKKKAKLEVDPWRLADKAAAYTQTNWRGPAQEIPSPKYNMVIPTIEDCNALNYGKENQNQDTNSALAGCTQISSYTASYPGTPGASYKSSYALATTSTPNAATSDHFTLPPPPQPSFILQNLILESKISVNPIGHNGTVSYPLTSGAPTEPERANDTKSSSFENGIGKMLNQKQDG